jgi:hypoxanthine phosphoribosyltransferase
MADRAPYAPDPAAGVLLVDWPLFGELSRALALKVARAFRPDLVVGVATAGVVPGAAVAAILDVPFHSILVSRRAARPDDGTPDRTPDRATPAVFGAAPPEARGARVLVVDETCDSGDTLRLAVGALVHAGAREVRTAVGFRRGPYAPDFHAMATKSPIVLPWDREILVGDTLRPNPRYAGVLTEVVA